MNVLTDWLGAGIWEILPGKLYQGGLLAATARELLNEFSLVVNCTLAAEVIRPGVVCLHFPFLDMESQFPNENHLRVVAAFAAKAIMRGERVLVHCAEGMNRSGLVNAMILVHLGICATGGAAVDYIRNIRPGTLSNKTFEIYLRGLPPVHFEGT
ncbi:MAG: dual specificity protein phosphatase family protein [Patescibacteria group bacterium]|nr:dual specificity protein phosphatase family protein [Patescibacteria group bacterium]